MGGVVDDGGTVRCAESPRQLVLCSAHALRFRPSLRLATVQYEYGTLVDRRENRDEKSRIRVRVLYGTGGYIWTISVPCIFIWAGGIHVLAETRHQVQKQCTSLHSQPCLWRMARGDEGAEASAWGASSIDICAREVGEIGIREE